MQFPKTVPSDNILPPVIFYPFILNWFDLPLRDGWVVRWNIIPIDNGPHAFSVDRKVGDALEEGVASAEGQIDSLGDPVRSDLVNEKVAPRVCSAIIICVLIITKTAFTDAV